MIEGSAGKKELTGLVLSDLHLFAARSAGDLYTDKVRDSASRVDFVVLCGDIFDFKWTTYVTIDETISAAITWLRSLCESAQECSIIYIMGNHDGIEPFKTILDDFAVATENFFWHPACYRSGDVLFLHGDIPFESKGCELAERKLKGPYRKKGLVMNFLYQVFTDTGGLKLYRYLHNKERIIKYISTAVEAYEKESGNTIKRVFFGHSHVPFTDIEYNGVTFNNTGSSIKGLPFNMMQIAVNTDE